MNTNSVHRLAVQHHGHIRNFHWAT